ncbi:MAG: [protein-PII] uridylyltransferase [Proteobacteria bacterium]|nr:[protein-PII] uridylyltransferase [Pseudomonadota bacterium]
MTSAPSVDAFLAALPPAGEEGDRDTVPAVRAYLKEARSYLEALHRENGSGRRVNEANSDLIDRLVRRLFERAEAAYLAGGGAVETGVAVVAVGGYARREMSIHSDVDLLVLYRDELSPYVTSVAERLQYWLWDARVSVGCATRTVAETVALGREDHTVRTAVLTARFLIGDGEFFHTFADTIRRELLPDVPGFLREQLAARAERHRAQGESLYLLQPNVKEGAGALRDYHGAYWVARGAQPAVRHLDDFLHFGLLTEWEMDRYRIALDFLWRVRNELHLLAGRRNDQMSFELQEQIAKSFGYADDAEGAELPVERFMRDYYRHARAISNYSELVIEQCTARIMPDTAGDPPRDVEDGFRVAGGQLEIPHAAHLREKPVRMLTAFEVAQRHQVPLSRIARRLIRENLPLARSEEFRTSPESTAVFERILDAEHRVMRTLMVMNEIGLLGSYLPEWEHIVFRWQHVVYHTYTVDVHSIFLVEELRRVYRGKVERAMPRITEVMQAVDDRPVLYLGCLLHDIGKGFGGDHSRRGATRARQVCERLGFSAERTDRVVFLVEHHLLMSHLAQRRDLSDPNLICEFARLCGDRENLRNLVLVTFADIRASSRDAWTDWKGQLLWELFERTAELLEAGADDPDTALELLDRRVEVRQERARSELRRQGVGDSKIESFFSIMPRRYFVSHGPRQMARHARVMLGYTPKQVLSLTVKEMRGEFSELILVTRDLHGLYAKVAGVLTACGINILGSHVYTTRSGLALEIYRLTTPRGGPEERDLAWRELEDRLREVLSGETDIPALMARRRRPYGRPAPPSREPASVLISNNESDFYTIVDVTTDDRIGLLYDLTQTIADHGFEIYISKAATVLDQVADTFYLKDSEGRKLQSEADVRALQQELLAQATQDPGGGGG